jgi:hypothetical protein
MADPTPFKAELVKIARGEHESLGGLQRGDQRLEKQIKLYCDEVGLAMTDSIKAHYSAVFISWCIHKAHASEKEFPAVAAHWQYARRAVLAAAAANGMFRGRRIESYAPQLGDLIHVNRNGGQIDYDIVRNGSSPYRAESGIVIEVGAKEALIVMGNQEPLGNVGTEKLALDESGFLVQRAKDPFICVIEVLK